MGGQRVEEPQEHYGSTFARMFGYVTDEDRSRWEQQRARSRPKVSAARQATKTSVDSMLEFGDKNVSAKLNAAHRVAQQQEFDEGHDKIVTQRRDPRTRSITETVDYEDKDTRTEIEPDLEL